jgi:predicted nucleic acid-binding protein
VAPGRPPRPLTGRVFVDTNVFVYLFDNDAPAKRDRARELLDDRAFRRRIVLSSQVLQEFYVTVTRKLETPLDADQAVDAVRDLTRFVIVTADARLVLDAIDRSRTEQLSLWDALIVQAALSAGARHLYSEDLQDGRVIEGLTIENPFVV